MSKSKAKARVAIAKDALAWMKAGALRAKADYGYVAPMTVCALGGLMLAKAQRFDEVTVENLLSDGIHEQLRGYFKYGQIVLIEAAFEGRRGFEAWREQTPNDSKRYATIMQNIIRNKGEFVVDDVPKQRPQKGAK